LVKPSHLAVFLIVLISACTSGKKKTTGFYFTSLPSSETGISFENTITESDSLNLLVNEYTYMGSGVGVGDFNNDGLQDVFFAANQESSRLFLNKGSFHFEDISRSAGVQTTAWCTGVNVVDINQDGWLDIYVCVSGTAPAAERKNLLFVNQHDLTFREEAEAYHLADTSFCTQAVFFDYDKDGDLDMYLLNHRLQGDIRNIIRPKITDGTSPLRDALYRNEGVSPGLNHPVYRDVTAEAGITDDGYGLGVAVSDLNGDSYPDIYVANDYIGNDDLWLNNRNGTFTNCIATALRHQSYSSMGTDIADYNNDGLPDIATLDMQPETNERKKMMYSFLNDVRYKLERDAGYEPEFMRNMLHLNGGVRGMAGKEEPFFSEIGQLAGISETDWSWSVLMADFDNDGWKDMHITNGMGRDLINADFVQYRAALTVRPDDPNGENEKRKLVKELASIGSVPLQNYLYRNKGDLTFEDISSQAGITEKAISNGAVFADLDNDGDLDLITNNINGKASVLRNGLIDEPASTATHFIGLQLEGDSMNKQGVGTKVIVHTGGSQQFFEQQPARGYLSSVDQRIHIGLGKQQPDSIVIIWPDDKEQTIVRPPIDTFLHVHKREAKQVYHYTVADTTGRLFTDITSRLGLPYHHAESFFHDYGFQSLLPQKYSQEGPFISTGDLNGDGLEDFFAGGAYGQQGKIFMQQADGSFTGKDIDSGEKNEEDMQSLLLDADGDKDPDLLIISGSSEFDPGSPYYQPRLYINDGKGNFTRDATAIPGHVHSPSKSVAGADFDGDGDIDIFIGGRVMVGSYPQVPNSFLLRNDKGKFTDITPPVLQYPGLLNAAVWADIDGDKIPELILAGDWMPVRVFKNIAGSVTEVTQTCGMKDINGYWRSIIASDIDGDGDMDLLAGNLGLNNSFRISARQPAKLVARDFDGNGVIEPVFCYYIRNDKSVYEESVGISRDQWAAQAPSIKKKFEQNHSYSVAPMDKIISPDEMKQATVLVCSEARSGCFLNDGKGNFSFQPFEQQAQWAPVNTLVCADADGDGIKDVLLAGNEYEYNVAAGRMDASYGLWMKGNGKAGFAPVAPVKSGWITDGDVRDIKFITAKKWGRIMLVARNNQPLQVFSVK
jgi:enediyne biosynthesis protein E4